MRKQKREKPVRHMHCILSAPTLLSYSSSYFHCYPPHISLPHLFLFLLLTSSYYSSFPLPFPAHLLLLLLFHLLLLNLCLAFPTRLPPPFTLPPYTPLAHPSYAVSSSCSLLHLYLVLLFLLLLLLLLVPSPSPVFHINHSSG